MTPSEEGTVEKYVVSCPSCESRLLITNQNKAFVCPQCRRLVALRKQRRFIREELPSEPIMAPEETLETENIEESLPVAAATPAAVEAAATPAVVEAAATPAAEKGKKKQKMYTGKERREKLTPLTTVMLVVLVLYTVCLFMLIAWALIKAFQHPMEFNRNKVGFPEFWFFSKGGNFAYVFKNATVTKVINGVRTKITFGESVVNSILYAGGGAFVNTFVQCITAYLCARYAFKFSGVVYGAVIIAMILPVVGSLVSEIQMAQVLGIYDQIWGTWIMKANFLGMYFLVFHEMFKALPQAYSEAATIDGASDWRILWAISFPLAKNTFLTVLLINFVAMWNDYQTPMVYLPTHPTIAERLHWLRGNSWNWLPYAPVQLAAPFILMVPILVIFLCFHKRLLGNLTIGGVKG